MKRKWLVFTGIACLFAVPFLLKLVHSETAQLVEVQKVAPREIKASILASGNLVFQEQALLSPEVIGKVRSVLVKEGDHVEAGQVVLTLDDQAYRADLAQQQALVRQGQIDIEHQQLSITNQTSQYQRKLDMQRLKMVSDSALDDARYAFDLSKIELRKSREGLQQAQAVLNQSMERLAKTNIRSPISGTVTSLDIKVGETAVASQIGIAGSSLMTIANTASLMAEVNVDEADIARIMLGQEVLIHTAAYPDTPLTGVVKTIPLSPKKDSGQTGTSLARNYSVKVSIANPDKLILHPGMTCRAEIYTATSGKSLAVPLQAVQSNNDQQTDVGADNKTKNKATVKIENYVFVLENGVSHKRVVKLGISDDTNQEIVAGLTQGDSVIIGPYKILRHLKPDEKLQASAANETAAVKK
ncbi:efflux RND transporter periplasmic adaptor subunit [Solimicrobium silvestre]|uniref:Efflux transporter, RND family, MFP subunit n=1 Tax=Solimicrobium silvestre TaxID=2099400 RepID=A0A2S9H3C8_9BURK|nr:efflux RND transporter periplasmic adaptor subunit [Solimicrobium silvestre]PRC94470.1 Efflux transporter, RND family, MFP subunit [Solimicrobium silvestre]